MSDNTGGPTETEPNPVTVESRAVCEGAACDSAGIVIPLSRRAVHAAFAAVAIIALGWWSWYSDPDLSLREAMADPVALEGSEIKIGDEPLLESSDDEFFFVRSRGFRFRVSGRVPSEDIGQFIYVRGIFQQPPANADWDGDISPAEHRVARGRHAKIWLSVIPVLWIGVLLLRHFQINWKRLAIEERLSHFNA